jgi:PKD repeat protein
MVWFGSSSHIDIGYRSDDPLQIRRQVTDMLSRGIQGAIVDWYGPGREPANQATINLRAEAESRGGKFSFAVMEDVGALGDAARAAGCSATDKLVEDLKYATNNFATSPAYMKIGGRPVFFFFGVDHWYIDWNAVRSRVPGDPLFLFLWREGFTHAQSNGAYDWVKIRRDNPYDMNLGAIDEFLQTSLQYPSSKVFANAYKGFDDTIASWTGTRIVDQQCGKTWVATLAEIGKFYNSTRQLQNLQLVTWNDYEEGSAIESGIDNCINVDASVVSATLRWTARGNEGGVAYYNVYISRDGTENVALLKSVSVATHSLDLNAFLLPAGTYQLYVQAFGKASFLNKLSGPVVYRTGNREPVAALNVNTTTGTVPFAVVANNQGSYDPDGTIVSRKIDFGDGYVAAASSASHTYSKPGIYKMLGTVVDNTGVATTKSIVIDAKAPSFAVNITDPTAGFSTNLGLVRVSANIVGRNPITAARVWIDNQPAFFLQNPRVDNALKLDTRIGMKGGTRYIVVQAWDTTGANVTASRTITVAPNNSPPQARLQLTPPTGAAPLTVLACTANSSDLDGGIASSRITFPTAASSGVWARYTFAAAGTFSVSATVYDGFGASATTSTSVTVGGQNVVVSSPHDGNNVGSPVHFVASASATKPITAIRIYIDNQTVWTDYKSSIDVSLPVAIGKHYVVFQAWDSDGNVYRASLSITVI